MQYFVLFEAGTNLLGGSQAHSGIDSNNPPDRVSVCLAFYTTLQTMLTEKGGRFISRTILDRDHLLMSYGVATVKPEINLTGLNLYTKAVYHGMAWLDS